MKWVHREINALEVQGAFFRGVLNAIMRPLVFRVSMIHPLLVTQKPVYPARNVVLGYMLYR